MEIEIKDGNAMDVLRSYMTEKGYTYADIAERSNYSKQNIWLILFGKRKNRNEYFFRSVTTIAEAMNLELVVTPCEKSDPEEIMKAASESNIPFRVVHEILQANGFKIAFREKLK